jgi:hypothetical protein
MSLEDGQPPIAPWLAVDNSILGHASTLKFPAFCLELPELRFAQINCIFVTRSMMGIFDKFCRAAATLQNNSLMLVADILRSPPENLFEVSADQAVSPPQADGDGLPEGR